ncbi:phosphopantetheine-binding protein [Austwickia chelonae]|uniref:phosphopantetheine-binding protein n=1 Tax=Austwickia chelonae TaxID=100225 RepID=UPI000E26359C|nr:phosphopantetheine-binding protein [Austwickia chelonae]
MQNLMRALTEHIADALGVSPADVDPDISLADQGLDSVRMMGVVELIREAGHDIDFIDLADDPRLNAWEELFA